MLNQMTQNSYRRRWRVEKYSIYQQTSKTWQHFLAEAIKGNLIHLQLDSQEYHIHILFCVHGNVTEERVTLQAHINSSGSKFSINVDLTKFFLSSATYSK